MVITRTMIKMNCIIHHLRLTESVETSCLKTEAAEHYLKLKCLASRRRADNAVSAAG